MRLAHLSDIHLGPLPKVKRHQLMNKRITGYANWRLNRSGAMQDNVLDGLVDHMKSMEPDHIAVTGDLVNLALTEEIRLARIWLDMLGDPKDVSAVPGNHDVYVPDAMRKIVSEWQPFMLGDAGREDGHKNPFPYRRDRGDVAIIGVNSGRATMPFMSTGSFREKQAQETADLLDEAGADGKFRVVLIHHPPFPQATTWSKRLIGASLFRKTLLRHGAELVLHGHTHIVSDESIKGPNGTRIPVLGVPAASQAPPSIEPPTEGKKPRPGARYNLFDISGAPGEWSCNWREFGYDDGASDVALLAEQRLYGR